MQDDRIQEAIKLKLTGPLRTDAIYIADGRVSHRRDSVALAGARASVETAGDIDRRVTGTRLLLTGPLALGLRKKNDSRELYLTVEGSDGAFVVKIDPAFQRKAREAAAQINSHGQRALPEPKGSSTLDQLRQLGELRDSGVLTEAEFADQKAKILETS